MFVNNRIKISWKFFFFLRKGKSKIFSNINMITLLAVLIALRMGFQYINFYIPQFNISISISWLPLIGIGWIFGPLFGFVCGIVTDTLCYLIKPTSVWFWMYAIQEPIVGFLSGLFSFIYQVRTFNINKKNNVKKHRYILDLIFFQIFLIGFSILSFLAIFLWANENFKFQGASSFESTFFDKYKYILISLFILFFIFMEFFIFYFYKKNKKKNFLLILYISFLIILNSFIFSYILGPITSVEYYKFLHNTTPPLFIKYGVIFYLVPRILKETVKAPIAIFALSISIPLISNIFNKILDKTKIKWA